jgi:hypothetical protein
MANRVLPLLVGGVLVVSGDQGVWAGDVEAGRQIHTAALRLRDEVFDNCIVKMEQSATSDWSGMAGRLRQSGTVVFARVGACVLSDRDVALTQNISSSDGQPRRDSHTYSQRFMANGRRCIQIDYEPTKTGKRVVHVRCDPRRSYDESFLGASRAVHLDSLLAEFGSTGKTLVVLTEVSPESVKRTKGGLTAVYPTVYGPLEVSLERIGGKDAITTVRMAQAATDVYTSLFNGGKLADVRDSVLEKTPDGLTSLVTEVVIDYKGATGSKPISTITEKTTYTAAGKEYRGTRFVRLTEYRKCMDEKEVEALMAPIPEGQVVGTADPEYRPLTLTYRKGDVVREVDGASLEQVATEKRVRRSVLYIVLPVLAVVLLAGGGLWVYARRRAARTPEGT